MLCEEELKTMNSNLGFGTFVILSRRGLSRERSSRYSRERSLPGNVKCGETFTLPPACLPPRATPPTSPALPVPKTFTPSTLQPSTC